MRNLVKTVIIEQGCCYDLLGIIFGYPLFGVQNLGERILLCKIFRNKSEYSIRFRSKYRL